MRYTRYPALFLLLVAAATNALAQLQKGKSVYGEAARDLSGESISMPDSLTIGIGAHWNDGNGTNAGHVRVYAWNGTSWLQKGSDINGEAANDESGTSVSMPDARTIAIGAPLNDGGTTDAGHVRVFRWNGSGWLQKGSDINGGSLNEQFGRSVSMPDSNTVAIGAWGSNANGTQSGRVRIYSWNGSAWVAKGSNIPGEAAGDASGVSVSMPDANTVAIGAHLNDGGGSNAGHARVYVWSGSAWVQKGSDINGVAAENRCGFSVSMPNANTIAVGAPRNSGNGTESGHTRVFAWNGSSWQLKGSAINGDAAGNWAGYAVSMPNPDLVAVGAFYANGKYTGVGQVKMFKWNGSSWTQKGTDIVGDTLGDYLGRCVSMPDEKTLGVSAPYNDLGGDMIGQVKIFDVCSSTKTLSLTRCNQLISPSKKYTWTRSGTYTDVIPNADGCDSIITIQLTILTTAAPTGSDSQYFCNHAEIADLLVSGTSLQWYDTATAGKPLDRTTPLTDGKTYYATQTLSGCESNTRMAVQVFINAPATPGGMANQTFCQSAGISDLLVTGSSIQWYDTAVAGSPLSGSIPLSDNKAYYASQTVAGCESKNRLKVMVTILQPAAPTGSGAQTFCNSAVVSDLKATGSSLLWYDTTLAGTSLIATTTLTDGKVYYASQTISGCESSTRLAVTVSILVPAAPTGLATQSFCNSATVADLMATGSSIRWYATPGVGNALSGTSVLKQDSSYYASQTISGCEGNTRLAVKAKINSVTDITTRLSGNTITANNDSASYVWLDCDNNFAVIPGQTAKSFVAAANGYYAVRLMQKGCVDTSACVRVNTLGLQDKASEALPRVYPNPTNGTFTIHNDHPFQGLLVEMHDTRGRSILRQYFQQATTLTFSLKEPAGIYILTLQSPYKKSAVILVIE